MSGLTQTDLANVAVLLKRVRTGKIHIAPGPDGAPIALDWQAMSQRVEAHLSEAIRKMDAPLGDGGPAYPIPNSVDPRGDFVWGSEGMTLRDRCAVAVLPALAVGKGAQDICDRDPRYTGNNFAEVVAVNCYEFADAMLKARQA